MSRPTRNRTPTRQTYVPDASFVQRQKRPPTPAIIVKLNRLTTDHMEVFAELSEEIRQQMNELDFDSWEDVKETLKCDDEVVSQIKKIVEDASIAKLKKSAATDESADAAENKATKKGKKRKKGEDGNEAEGRSKKPLTPYMLFVQKARPQLVKERPELKFSEMGKELGAMWRDLPDEEKAKYKAEADEDRARYKAENPTPTKLSKAKSADETDGAINSCVPDAAIGADQKVEEADIPPIGEATDTQEQLNQAETIDTQPQLNLAQVDINHIAPQQMSIPTVQHGQAGVAVNHIAPQQITIPTLHQPAVAVNHIAPQQMSIPIVQHGQAGVAANLLGVPSHQMSIPSMNIPMSIPLQQPTVQQYTAQVGTSLDLNLQQSTVMQQEIGTRYSEPQTLMFDPLPGDGL
jgi:hypothetical protein